jgi:hypothetical protein
MTLRPPVSLAKTGGRNLEHRAALDICHTPRLICGTRIIKNSVFARLNLVNLTIVYYGSTCVLEKINQLAGHAPDGLVLGLWHVIGDEAEGSQLGCVR